MLEDRVFAVQQDWSNRSQIPLHLVQENISAPNLTDQNGSPRPKRKLKSSLNIVYLMEVKYLVECFLFVLLQSCDFWMP